MGCITIERKLGDDKDCAADFTNRAIEATVAIGENAQSCNLSRYPLSSFFGIATVNAQVHKKPALDGAYSGTINTHGCSMHALDDSAHGSMEV